MFLYLFNSQLSIFNILYRADTKRQANTFCRSIDVASWTRYFIVTHIRRSAAMTHEVTGRHPAHTLRRCYYAKGVSLCTRRARGCPQRGHAFS